MIVSEWLFDCVCVSVVWGVGGGGGGGGRCV